MVILVKKKAIFIMNIVNINDNEKVTVCNLYCLLYINALMAVW